MEYEGELNALQHETLFNEISCKDGIYVKEVYSETFWSVSRNHL